MEYLLKRMPSAVATVLVASFLSFCLLYFAPGDAAYIIITQKLDEPDYEAIEHFILKNRLDLPVLEGYILWLSMVFLHFDFGNSLRTGEEVLQEFLVRFPATLTLALSALLFAVFLGITLGMLSALKSGTFWDSIARAVTSAGISIPEFWLGMLLILLFSLKLGILPSFGYGSVEHLIMPTLVLGFHLSSRIARVTRESMLDVMEKNYILAARARGYTERRVIFIHAFRNALIPVATLAGMDLGHLLGGAVIVESIFAWPGVGKFMVDSLFARDFPVVSGFIMIFTFFFVSINLLVDLLYMRINPKIRVTWHARE